jgi:hypothetical protein
LQKDIKKLELSTESFIFDGIFQFLLGLATTTSVPSSYDRDPEEQQQ